VYRDERDFRHDIPLLVIVMDGDRVRIGLKAEVGSYRIGDRNRNKYALCNKFFTEASTAALRFAMHNINSIVIY
jgi:adenylylsulfate kinase-like enzyme